LKNATFRQLRFFNAVARHLSFAKAAASLHVSAPAVTMQIKDLEAQLGFALFDRSGKQVSLTSGGEYMLVFTRKILATLKDAEDAAARLQHVQAGVLTIGMVNTATYFMMPMLAEFRRKHEGVEIQMATGNRQQLVQMLKDNEVDIAIMGRPPQELQTRAEPFAAHPHVFVAAVDHPLAGRSRLAVEALRGYAFIVREPGSGTRAAMEKFFAEARMELILKIQVQSNETLKQAVMAGLGMGFLSLHTIGHELAQQRIAMLDIAGAPVVRAWNVVHTQSKMLSPAAEAFRYFMLEQGEAYLAQHFGHYMPMG
jgi:DNA-binding transcriptional LysR family regulator